eukprot:CAMPEP_0179059530 /NCGR_PEP_ID=MMETSP0796-20121207/25399_1 /TAXON_ID=73915 /ORGANISM="Pyrodinium bahamense, Strain pbaha01" /LENGTH=64 /DNA_ID=CAMNT_0020756287 /DNA_START=230 /DNA_END=424 /DNA_ORIENTATION=-
MEGFPRRPPDGSEGQGKVIDSMISSVRGCLWGSLADSDALLANLAASTSVWTMLFAILRWAKGL